MLGSPQLRRLHHVGFVVQSIVETLPGMLESLGGEQLGEVIHDPVQRVKVVFLQVGAGTNAQIELVEPAGEDSPVGRFVEKGGGMHHLCYEVEDLTAALAGMKSRRVMVVSQPKPAVAFGGRRIAWVMTRERLLVELLETGAVDAS